MEWEGREGTNDSFCAFLEERKADPTDNLGKCLASSFQLRKG